MGFVERAASPGSIQCGVGPARGARIDLRASLARPGGDVLTQNQEQDDDENDSTDADIHLNLHRVADPLRG